MPIIDWNEKLIIGVSSMDYQHQYWVRLINELHEAMIQGKGHEMIGEILIKILGYTRVHFLSEERLMIENGYPTYIEHKKIHDGFIKEMTNLQDRLNQGHTMLSIELINQMTDWLVQHIQYVDRRYVPFVKK